MNEELKMVVDTLISEMSKMEARINKRLDQQDKRMDRMEADVKIYVNGLVDEMGRMESRINERFEKVDERFDRMDAHLDSMQHEINACKLEAGTLDLLLKKIDQLWPNTEYCKCERCRMDIAAYALNRLPPRYVHSLAGELIHKFDA